MKKIYLYIALIIITVTIIILGTIQLTTSNLYSKPILDEYSYKIPNLDTTFVPQGLCEINVNGRIYKLITAYDFEKKKNSVIYIIDENGKHLKTISLENTYGKHLGGITEYNNELWIASTKRIYIISKTTLINAKNNFTISPTVITFENIDNSNQGYASFCTEYNNTLCIGTFDEEETSTAYGYKYDKVLKQLKLVASINVPKRCQGMVFQNSETVFFSTSFEGYDSKIYKYTIEKVKTINGVVEYQTDEEQLVLDVPDQAEQIYLTDSGDLYVLFESGSKVYKRNKLNLFRKTEDRVVLIDL